MPAKKMAVIDLLGGMNPDVPRTIKALAAENVSVERIAGILKAEFGIDVTRQTVHRWLQAQRREGSPAAGVNGQVGAEGSEGVTFPPGEEPAPAAAVPEAE